MSRLIFSIAFPFAVIWPCWAEQPPNRILTSDELHGPIDALVFWSGPQLVSVNREGQVVTWDLQTRQIIARFHAGEANSFPSSETRVALSPDGVLLCAGSGIWHLGSEELMFRLTRFRGVALSRSLLASWTPFGLHVQDVVTRKDCGQIGGNDCLFATPLAFSPDGELLIVESTSVGKRVLARQIVVYETGSKRPRLKTTSPTVTPAARISGDNRRYRAQAKLELLGPIVADEIRKAQKDATSLEISLRLARILKKLDDLALNQEWLRKRRAIEALELIGSPEAIELLERQAPKHAQDQIADEARASLKRIRQGPIGRRPKALKKEPMPLRDGIPVPNPETRPSPAGQRITFDYFRYQRQRRDPTSHANRVLQ